MASIYMSRFVTAFGMGRTKIPPCGTRSWHWKNNDTPEDPPVAEAIDEPGFLQFMRETQEELPEQEGGEAAEKARHDQTLQRADPPQVRYDNVDRHKDHREGDHQGKQDGEEDQVCPAIRDAGEAIARVEMRICPTVCKTEMMAELIRPLTNGTSGSLSNS
jgi:hypothetical protein